MTEPSHSFRVGIAGLSPVGRFLLERLSLLPHCEPVLFQSADGPPDAQAESLGIPHISDWQRFLFASELKTVLFLDGGSLKSRQVEQAFQANLRVGFLPPFNWQPAEWPELTRHGQWFLLNPHHEDADFRAAQQAMQTGELGPPAAIKRICWVAESIDSENACSAADFWLPQLLWEDVDQLLRLAGEVPESIHVAEFRRLPASYCLMFQFPSGLTAHLERRRGMAVPLDLGWILSSPLGGYANGQRHIKTEAGEIYDVPVELPPLAVHSVFDSFSTPAADLSRESEREHVSQILQVLQTISRFRE